MAKKLARRSTLLGLKLHLTRVRDLSFEEPSASKIALELEP